MDGSQGVTGWLIPPARFRQSPPSWEDASAAAFERAFDLSIDTAAPTEPVNTLSGYALYSRRLRVRVSYGLQPQGDDGTYEATGDQSGGADIEAIEDRADADGVLIRAVIGSLRNWASLVGIAVIDVRPEAQDPPEADSGRVVYTHVFTVLSRDALPSSYGPTL